MENIQKKLLCIGMPLSIGFIAQMTISFSDAALVARLGPEQLAGTTLALSLFTLVMLFGIGFISAISPYVAEAFKLDEMDKIKYWYSQGQWVSFFIGVTGCLILLSTQKILVFFGVDQQLAHYAQEYNSGSAPGLFFFLLYVNARSLASAIGKPALLTFVMLISIPINLLLGWFTIFQSPFSLGLGIYGAGLSSSLIRLIIFVSITIIFMREKTFKQLDISILPSKPKVQFMAKIFRTGAPIGLRITLGEGFIPAISFFVSYFGQSAIASHSIMARLLSLAGVFVLGFSGAASTLAAWLRAENDWLGLQKLRNSLLSVSFLYVMLVSSLIIFSFKFIINSIFSVHDLSMISIMNTLLPLLLLSLFLDTLGNMYNGFLVGMLDTSVPTVVVVSSYWVIGLGFGFIFSHFDSLGFIGYWVSMIISSLIVLVFNLYRTAGHIVNLRENILTDSH